MEQGKKKSNNYKTEKDNNLLFSKWHSIILQNFQEFEAHPNYSTYGHWVEALERKCVNLLLLPLQTYLAMAFMISMSRLAWPWIFSSQFGAWNILLE